MTSSVIARFVDTPGEERAAELAVADSELTLSWTELRRAIVECAQALDRLDARDRVVLYLPQSARALALLLACAERGVDAILVSNLYPEAKAQATVTQTGAQGVVALDGTNVVALGALTPARPREAEMSREPIIGVLTSGSTGAPKCAEHTWTSLTAKVRRTETRTGKRWLLCYPLSHIAALQVVAQAMVNHGALVLPGDLGAASALAAIAKHRVQCISSTPTFVRQLLHGAPASFWADAPLEQIIMGGEIVDQSVLDTLHRAAPRAQLTHIYATTELGAVIVVRDGKEGFPAELLDGELLRLEDGQLSVRRSSSSMRRYLGGAGDAAPGDWWPTGDLIEVSDGRARFKGREFDLINVGGFKVSPIEVEAVLREVPGVRNVAVVAHPSTIAGNLVKAVIEPTDDADRGKLRAAAIELCRSRLPSHMLPRMFEFVDQIPITITQKQSRLRRHVR